MALTVNNKMMLYLFDGIFGAKKKISPNSAPAGVWSFRPDAFASSFTDQVLKKAVAKLQAAVFRPFVVRLNMDRMAQSVEEPPAPAQWEIDRAVEKAGGLDNLSLWLVDGKTRLDVNGSKIVTTLAPELVSGAGRDETKTVTQLREEAEAAIARFDIEAASLDLGGNLVRERLDEAAAVAAKGDNRLALAIEYALEDAYAKVYAWEHAVAGVFKEISSEERLETNLKQAESIVDQLQLGADLTWAIQSLAHDLAAFDLDFSSLSNDPRKLTETIKSKSGEMLADLEKRYSGSEAEYFQERNRITGASARLLNGLASSAGTLIQTSMNMGASVSISQVPVSVDDVKINGSAVVAIATVIVDPLVLDLSGNGITLKSADDGIEFDMNGDGQKTGMGFIQGETAFLFIDIYDDGLVHDGRQLFGNVDGYANGFEMLRVYDSNGDGVIDENDDIFDKLMLWMEKNENGICDAGETMTLREAGVKSISLGYENVRLDDGNGNLIGQIGGFTREDSSQGVIADVWLQEKRP